MRTPNNRLQDSGFSRPRLQSPLERACSEAAIEAWVDDRNKPSGQRKFRRHVNGMAFGGQLLEHYSLKRVEQLLAVVGWLDTVPVIGDYVSGMRAPLAVQHAQQLTARGPYVASSRYDRLP